MKLTYDPRHGVAYLRLRDKPAVVETVAIGEDVNVDLGPDGTVYGIELLNANEQLLGADEGKLVVVNEAEGVEHEIVLVPREGATRARA